jgi:hypothetical protein
MYPLKLVFALPAIPGQAANIVPVVNACSAFEAAGCPIATLLSSVELRAAPFRDSIMKQPRRFASVIRGLSPEKRRAITGNKMQLQCRRPACDWCRSASGPAIAGYRCGNRLVARFERLQRSKEAK